eukprot:TRINITY_DN84488_c0_g1_i1.p1 TRINITY_DN84488_c0_g1~~TRINITY_DN84488_c0_g1_i1.p1  ORF type:complete len:120 (+),score=4.78 TRINITY_DN84488_c0_g1_i1:17-376(+)
MSFKQADSGLSISQFCRTSVGVPGSMSDPNLKLGFLNLHIDFTLNPVDSSTHTKANATQRESVTHLFPIVKFTMKFSLYQMEQNYSTLIQYVHRINDTEEGGKILPQIPTANIPTQLIK